MSAGYYRRGRTLTPDALRPGELLEPGDTVSQPDRSKYNQVMRYAGTVFRPPSEADSYLLQATIGCSWDHCTYCAMYHDKQFHVRPLAETLEDVAMAGRSFGPRVRKVFVMDGDALAMGLDLWEPILESLRNTFPNLRRVSCYATALNLLAKSQQELERLHELGLKLLYIGPESGDDVTLKRIAKGATSADHVEAAAKARDAGIKQSLIFLLGVGGAERSVEHATASARLATAMDPEFLSALTLMIVPTTPIYQLAESRRFEMPSVEGLLRELRIIVAEVNPSDTIFRSNHASNYLPIGGRLPRDRQTILREIDAALSGDAPIRAEWSRGL
jgi:radical SAM superfamily enzyme YgiQ (UPF0313 family)